MTMIFLNKKKKKKKKKKTKRENYGTFSKSGQTIRNEGTPSIASKFFSKNTHLKLDEDEGGEPFDRRDTT